MHNMATEPWAAPATDPARLWALGVNGVPLAQYLRWADDAGVFAAMADRDAMTLDEIVAATSLTDHGARAVLGILCSLHVVARAGASYVLSDVAREYLDRRRPYYLGSSLYGMLAAPLPPQLCKGQAVRRYSRFTGTWRDFVRYLRRKNQFGRRAQLTAQHCRNLPINMVAANNPGFVDVRHLADIGGGSGAFAIPLALRYPSMRITLVELPRALRHIPPFLGPHSLGGRIRLLGWNVHRTPWPLRDCDAVLFGNILHFCDDAECLELLRESVRVLPSGGRVFVHEMLWGDAGDGPLTTALWSFWMATISAGRQRTRAEVYGLLTQCNLAPLTTDSTIAGFSLIAAVRA
jgi:hypothetical protein